jgi:hypothetical protein
MAGKRNFNGNIFNSVPILVLHGIPMLMEDGNCVYGAF